MPPTQPDPDRTAILRVVDTIIESLAAKDLPALGRLYATDVVSFDVEPPLQHLGRAAKLANWQRVFAIFADVRYEVRDLALTVGDDVAFSHGFARISGTLRGGTPTAGMWVRATLCFRKIAGNWVITHDQASVPFDIGTGRGVIDLQP